MNTEELNKQLSEEIQAMKNPVFETILGPVPLEEIEEIILETDLEPNEIKETQINLIYDT